MDVVSALRAVLVTLAVAVVAAGCAAPEEATEGPDVSPPTPGENKTGKNESAPLPGLDLPDPDLFPEPLP